MHISQSINNVLKVLDILVCALRHAVSQKSHTHDQKEKPFVLIILQTQIMHSKLCIFITIYRFSNALLKGKEKKKPLTGAGCVNYTRGYCFGSAQHRSQGISQKQDALNLDYTS